jgi:hypothetical protein
MGVSEYVRDFPTDQGPEVPVKWTWPARNPTDLQLVPETLSATPVTMEDSRRSYPDPGGSAGLGAQGTLLGCGSAPPIGLKIVGFLL